MTRRNIKYYEHRAAEIRRALAQDGLEPELKAMLRGALFVAEWRIAKNKRKNIKPKLN